MNVDFLLAFSEFQRNNSLTHSSFLKACRLSEKEWELLQSGDLELLTSDDRGKRSKAGLIAKKLGKFFDFEGFLIMQAKNLLKKERDHQDSVVLSICNRQDLRDLFRKFKEKIDPKWIISFFNQPERLMGYLLYNHDDFKVTVGFLYHVFKKIPKFYEIYERTASKQEIIQALKAYNQDLNESARAFSRRMGIDHAQLRGYFQQDMEPRGTSLEIILVNLPEQYLAKGKRVFYLEMFEKERSQSAEKVEDVSNIETATEQVAESAEDEPKQAIENDGHDTINVPLEIKSEVVKDTEQIEEESVIDFQSEAELELNLKQAPDSSEIFEQVEPVGLTEKVVEQELYSEALQTEVVKALLLLVENLTKEKDEKCLNCIVNFELNAEEILKDSNRNWIYQLLVKYHELIRAFDLINKLYESEQLSQALRDDLREIFALPHSQMFRAAKMLLHPVPENLPPLIRQLMEFWRLDDSNEPLVKQSLKRAKKFLGKEGTNER